MRRPAASSAESQAPALSRAADRVEHVEHRAGRAAVERALERAQRRDHRRDGIGARGRHDARGEGGRVHAVLGHRDEVRVEAAREGRRRRRARQHAQQVFGVAEVRDRARRARGRAGRRRQAASEHRDRADQPAARAFERLRGGAQGREARAQRVHGVVGVERGAEPRELGEGLGAPAPSAAPDLLARAPASGSAPSQSRPHTSSKRVRGERLDRMPAHHQPPALAVHPRERRLGHHHALEPGPEGLVRVHGVFLLARLNVDCDKHSSTLI